MSIISVAATGNGSGKTSMLSTIHAAFPGTLDAIKFTTVFSDGVNCPRTATACACRELHGRFRVVTDPDILASEETDTGRLIRSGARSMLWCLARPGAHRELWAHVRSDLLEEGAHVITEGNSIVPFLSSDLVIMVMSPRLSRARWKPDTWDLAGRADFVVVNTFGSSTTQNRELAAEVAGRREGRPPIVEDVARSLADWRDSTLREALESLLEHSKKKRA